MWTVGRIKELCVQYCARCDVKFKGLVAINGRLTRTLGRCVYWKNTDGEWHPTKIEISRQLLETATDESIEAVIAHECAHYVACELTHENHGHDSTFRYYCQKIGTTNDTAAYKNLQRIKPREEVYRYTIYCAKCGELMAVRSRACRLTKYPEEFYSKCCDAAIKVVQNW